MGRWQFLFAALTAAMCVALALLVRENKSLRQQLAVMAATKARESGLDIGRMLEPIALRDAAGSPVAVRFEGEARATLLLFHASGCGACQANVPQWRRAIEPFDRAELPVFCVQTDADEQAPLALEGLPPSLAVPLPPVGWLATIPAVPATLLVDQHGVLIWAWYSELTSEMTRELAAAISDLVVRDGDEHLGPR